MGEYNVQQFTPVELDGDKCLLTSFATLENGRYFNPRSNKSFKYDHIKHVAYDVQGEAFTSHNDKLRETIQSKVENNFFKKYLKIFLNRSTNM